MELQSVNTENLRLIWQRDLECEISKDKWHNVVSKVGWATRDIREANVPITKLYIDSTILL